MRGTEEEPEAVLVPPKRQLPAAVAGILSRYVDRDRRLRGDPAEAVPALVRDLELRGVARALVVCPVSLKAEWEEQPP